MRKRPKVFIGSSKEAIPYANGLFSNLTDSRKVEVNPWYSGTFRGNEYTMESLMKQIDENDFAVFILHTDDFTIVRDSIHLTVRDNVVFELGLFMGRLGRDRVFFVVPRELPETVKAKFEKQIQEKTGIEIDGESLTLRLPSDLYGIDPLKYESTWDNKESATLQASNRILEVVESLEPRLDYQKVLYDLEKKNETLEEELELADRLLRFIINAKKNPVLSKTEDFNELLSTFQSSFHTAGFFNVKGVTIFAPTEDGKSMIQKGRSGNVGTIGMTFPMEENESIVVEAHKTRTEPVRVKNRRFGREKEYLTSYPLTENYVVTVHLYGNIKEEEHEAVFNELLAANRELLIELKECLKGEE